jgi:putative restriction endonuclease
MAKAIFTTKVTPSYDDLPESRYQFPRTYLNQVRTTVGDHIIYYEPRRPTAEDSSRGGRQAYFATARVAEIIEDTAQADYFYALITDY